MKAVLLAAGKGERLKGVVQATPKPMIEYNGKPLLQHNLELCKQHGIMEIYINTHHLAENIRAYFGDGTKFGVKIYYSYEPELLGTSGALNNFRSQLEGESFYVLYGDNYSRYDLQTLKTAFQNNRCIGVIAFHHREDVDQSGVGEFDEDGRIVRFLEKPSAGVTASHWVNAGIYYLSPKILNYIPRGFSDFGQDIFPRLLKESVPLYGVRSLVALKAFDTPELLRALLGDSGDLKL
ncbi:MAG: nucleotidyltransferase family protein [Candidatus Kryptoniota bacterium]